MMLANEDSAFLSPLHGALALFESAIQDHHRDRPSAPYICASVERIAQDVADEALRWNFPNEPCTLDGVHWQFDIVIPKPLESLTNAPKLSEFDKHELQRFANALVGIEHHLIHRIPYIADGEALKEFPTPRLRFLAG